MTRETQQQCEFPELISQSLWIITRNQYQQFLEGLFLWEKVESGELFQQTFHHFGEKYCRQISLFKALIITKSLRNSKPREAVVNLKVQD